MKEYGDIPEAPEGMLQDGMTFRLDLAGRKDEDSMWAGSSGPGDWFFADEGS